jgi:hypothetical protein
MSSFAGIIQIKFNRIFSERPSAQLQKTVAGAGDLLESKVRQIRGYPPASGCGCAPMVEHRSPCRQIYLRYLDLETNSRYSASWSRLSGILKMQQLEKWGRDTGRDGPGCFLDWIDCSVQ